MKKSLDQVINILKSCESIIVEDNCAIPVVIDNKTGQILYFKYFDTNGQSWENQFNAKDNQEVEVIGSSIFLIDEDGDEIQITPLFTKELEPWI